jgi:hypothetical protein
MRKLKKNNFYTYNCKKYFQSKQRLSKRADRQIDRQTGSKIERKGNGEKQK